MAGFTLEQVFEAIGDQLRANLNGDFQIAVDPFDESTTVPRVALDLEAGDPIDWFGTFGPTGLAAVRIVVRLYPAGNVGGTDLRQLLQMLSVGTGNGNSVIDALMADKTLGGTASAFTVQRHRYDPERREYEIPLEVHINKQGAIV